METEDRLSFFPEVPRVKLPLSRATRPSFLPAVSDHQREYVVEVRRSIAVMRTRCSTGWMSKKTRQSPTRRRNPSWPPLSLRTSPPTGFSSIASIARRIRARSLDGMRLRDFCAGPARATSHRFFSSEFIEGHVITAFVRSSAATNGAHFGRGGSFLRELPNGNISAQRFTDKLGAGPMLCAHGFLDQVCHLWRQRNRNSLTSSHRKSGVTL